MCRVSPNFHQTPNSPTNTRYLLCRCGVDVNRVHGEAATPLTEGSLQAGGSESTALHCAIKANLVGMVRYLVVEAAADVNLPNNETVPRAPIQAVVQAVTTGTTCSEETGAIADIAGTADNPATPTSFYPILSRFSHAFQLHITPHTPRVRCSTPCPC